MLTYNLTDQSVMVVGDDFVPKTMPSTHPAFAQVVAALKAGNDNEVKQLMDLPNAIATFMRGKIHVTDRTLFYDGKPVTNSLATRVLQFMEAGDDELAQPLMNFLDKVKQNPSRRAAEGLYDWSVRSGLPITADGDIIAWKRVRDDYRDYHSGTFDNSVGQIVEVQRNEVDEDPDRTCSHGLHFCSTGYLPHYACAPRVMVVRINPADVVAFPRDYNTAKGRACRYEVIGEVPADKAKDFFPSLVSRADFTVIDDINTDPDGCLCDELQLDEFYRTRDGRVVQIISYDADQCDGDYPFTGAVLPSCTEEHQYGCYGSWNLYENHPLDLVEHLVDYDPDEPEPQPEGGWLSRLIQGLTN